MKKWFALAAAVGALGLLAGCSSQSTADAVTVELNTSGMAFDQKQIEIAKGQPVTFVLKNTDSVEHDFSVKTIPGKAEKKKGHATHGPKVDLHVHAAPLQTESLTFTPSKEGTYEFYCAVAGHKEAGMVGTLIVR